MTIRLAFLSEMSSISKERVKGQNLRGSSRESLSDDTQQTSSKILQENDRSKDDHGTVEKTIARNAIKKVGTECFKKRGRCMTSGPVLQQFVPCIPILNPQRNSIGLPRSRASRFPSTRPYSSLNEKLESSSKGRTDVLQRELSEIYREGVAGKLLLLLLSSMERCGFQ